MKNLTSKDLEIEPLEAFTPSNKTSIPQISEEFKTNIPSLIPPAEVDPKYGHDFEDYAIETNEWLSMALIESPRLLSTDSIDSFLSRYAPPNNSTPGSLVKIRWQGLISPTWAYKLFVSTLLATPQELWSACSISGFADDWGTIGHHSLVLKFPESQSDFVLWDVQ